MARSTKRSIAVIGLGTFGSTVARELAQYGNHVLGLDSEERNVSLLADELAEAVIADGRDEEALKQAGVGDYDVCVVAIGEDLEASILCVMNVRILGVETIWAKARSRNHHRILSKLGVDRVVLPEQEIGRHIAQMLHNPAVRDYVSLGNGFNVVDFQVPEHLDGTRLGELQLAERFELHCLGLMRGTNYFDCGDADTGLKVEDKLLLLGRRDNLRNFGDSL